MATFLVFLLGYVLSQFYRSFLAVIAPEMSAELSLSPEDLGNISGSWFLVFALAQFTVGWALDRIGPRRTVPVLMSAAIAGALLLSVAQNAWACIIAMGLIGLGCSPIYMGALYVFARTQKTERFAMLASWLLGVGTLGNLLGATPLAVLSEAIGWRAAFVGIAAITALSAFLVYLVVRDPEIQESGEAPRSALAELWSIMTIRALWPIMPIMLFGYAAVAAERGLWLGPFLDQVHGLDGVARGHAALVMAIGMSVGALIYGPLDQFFGTRKWVVAIGSAASAVAFFLLAFIPGMGVTPTVALLALAGGFGMPFGVILAHSRMFFPPHLVGRGITFMNFLGIGGIALVQFMSGRLVQARVGQSTPAIDIYSELHLLFALIIAASTLIYLFSREK